MNLSKKKSKIKLTTYAFIDSQNLNLGASKDLRKGRKIIYKGWQIKRWEA